MGDEISGNIVLSTNDFKLNSEKEKSFTDVLRMFAPGTSIRSALDDILRAHMGALIVLEKEGLDLIMEKGFRINSKFSAQKLVELAKMDGAIILSKDGKRILYANTLLSPDPAIPTKETGTRHKAAERTARQLGAIVIAVSERKKKISIYYGEERHELEGSSEILRRAAETVQILEKQREMFNDSLLNFNVLEINGLVTINDVCEILQRLEIIKRISDIVKRYLVELGKEGMIVSMRLKELTGGLTRVEEFILKDYFDINYTKSANLLSQMSFDFLLETSNISRILFEELHDKSIFPKGLRILSRANLLERHLYSLIDKFKNLGAILSLENNELLEIFETKENVEVFLRNLNSIKDKIAVGKNI